LLPLLENLFLIQSSSAGEGKTRKMAKGLILCHQDDVFAGESAGFGLPVLKTDHQTIFPSLFSSELRKPGIIEAVYHLNLINTWKILGISAPPSFSAFMEKIVSFYMNRPGFQSSGLKIRNTIFQLLQIRSTMKPGKSFGYCRVFYQTDALRLKIHVNGDSLRQRGQLILLNEVPGIGFSRLILHRLTRRLTQLTDLTESARNTLDGNDFLPWQTCSIDTAVENPDLHIGFFLSLPDNPAPQSFQIAAGREVCRDLNWAGLSLATDQAVFNYHVNFYSQKAGAESNENK
jgi:hypothetical protein